ncbi:MAG: PLP-dependent transferase, partial [Euryarchaeota archaeon]|nr:PLP-dependent transferase [Euryarchaeota archaeon]
MVAPIYQTAPFEFKSAEHAARVMSGKEKGYIYSRGLNPTTEVLEEKMAHLEGGEAALAQASGMAAISNAVFTLIKAGDHVIADEVIYGNTYDLFVDLENLGIDVSFVDTSDIRNVEDALRHQHELAKKQMHGFGGMIAFLMKDSKDIPKFLDALEICKLAVSLGEPDTLIQHPATMTHAV